MTVDKKMAVGETVSEALEQIANELNLDITELDFSVGAEQFISDQGVKIGLREMEVVAWKRVVKEGMNELKAWLDKTFELLNLEASVTVREANGMLHFSIQSEQGGQIIGRRGTTLKSIEQLMQEYASKMEYDWKFALHVDGGEEKSERRPRERERGDRDSRDSRGRGDRRGRDKSDAPNKRDDDALKRLAQRLASKVLEEGEPLVIEKDLNGYQRRIVHMTIKEFAGVASESFDQDGERKIRLVVDGSNAEEGSFDSNSED